MSFRRRSAGELAEAYRSGRATPREVAERALEAALALERRTPPMRAFLYVDHDAARAQADAATARHRAGRARGPLDGVPVALKDEFDVAGLLTTCGTAHGDATPAARDARVVTRLREAGAVLIGKTNMHELGMGPSGVNPHHGAARNPYDPARDTGGSSSGSAAAVAAGVVPIALGTDSGGSLRVPGALCGVAALKGTFGRVPTEGVRMAFRSVGHAGALGACVADVAAAFAVIADGGAEFAASPGARDAGRTRLAGLRVGVCEAWFRAATPAVRAAARSAVAALCSRHGARALTVPCPPADVVIPVGFAVFGSEADAHLADARRAGQRFGPGVELALALARGLSRGDLADAQRARALIARALRDALAEVDVLVAPTTGCTAPWIRADALRDGAVDEALDVALTRATLPANLAGLPAAQAPCGYDDAGLPIGLQVMARHGADALALEVAARVEAATEPRRPAVYHDLLG